MFRGCRLWTALLPLALPVKVERLTAFSFSLARISWCEKKPNLWRFWDSNPPGLRSLVYSEKSTDYDNVGVPRKQKYPIRCAHCGRPGWDSGNPEFIAFSPTEESLSISMSQNDVISKYSEIFRGGGQAVFSIKTIFRYPYHYGCRREGRTVGVSF